MTEHEIIGRQLVQIEQLGSQLDATVAVIHMLKDGKVTLDQITLSDGGFSVEDFKEEGVPAPLVKS